MKKFVYTITDSLGIHARPAGILVKTAGAYQAAVSIEKDGKSADAKRIFAVMGLGVKQGDEVTVTADGADETAAIEALETFFRKNL